MFKARILFFSNKILDLTAGVVEQITILNISMFLERFQLFMVVFKDHRVFHYSDNKNLVCCC